MMSEQQTVKDYVPISIMMQNKHTGDRFTVNIPKCPERGLQAVAFVRDADIFSVALNISPESAIELCFYLLKQMPPEALLVLQTKLLNDPSFMPEDKK